MGSRIRLDSIRPESIVSPTPFHFLDFVAILQVVLILTIVSSLFSLFAA